MKRLGKAIKKVGKMAVNAKTAKARAATNLVGKAASAVGAKKVGGALQNVAKRAKLVKGGITGDYKNDMGNKAARRELKYGGGKANMKRKGYRMGGSCQPVYSGDIPKAKAN